MGAHLQYLRHLLTASFWLVPTLMIAGGVGLALLALWIDNTLSLTWPDVGPWVMRVGPEGARVLLSTVAGSMITVAALVFSMTLVTLTLASTQLGPRTITRFMSDRINQLALGPFLATFLYSLLILQTVIEGAAEQAFVPHASLLIALVLTVIDLFALVFFIHHVARSIQADYVIGQVSHELHDAIHHRFPSIDPGLGGPAHAMPLQLLAHPATEIAPSKAGYVQAVDANALLEAAIRHDLTIKLEHRPGDFAIAGTALLLVWPRERVAESIIGDLRQTAVIGRQRTPTQDIEFAISQLVDIALRAMSPGINDPQTAIACVDHLGDGLAELMRCPPPPGLIEDQDGVLRLIVTPVTFERALGAAFDQIRQFAQTYFRVLMRMLEILTTLTRFVSDADQRSAIATQAAIIARTCRAVMQDEADLARAELLIARLDEALGEVMPEALAAVPAAR